jgi:hypothetical protein
LTIENEPGEVFSEDLEPVTKDGKWGYIDRLGTVRVPFEFTRAQPFSEGLAVVRVETVTAALHYDKYGYIDRSGTLKIPAIFDEAGAFSEGLAWIVRNHKTGYIDKSGSFVVEPRFDVVHPEWSTFAEGRAGAYRGGLWGYIDKTGGWALTPRYTGISSFHDGLAAVSQYGESGCKYIDYSGQKIRLVGEISGSPIRSNGRRELGSRRPRTRWGIVRLQLFPFVACCLSNSKSLPSPVNATPSGAGTPSRA